MKKPLQVPHFSGKFSLSDGAAVTAACEACACSFFHCFAKFFGADRRDELVRLARLLRSGLRRRRFGSRGGRFAAVRERPRREPEPRRRILAEGSAQPPQDLPLELAELERPCGRAGVDLQRSVTGESSRPRLRGHLLADRVGPAGDQVGHRTRRAVPAELASDGLADPLHQAALDVPSTACSTVTVCAGSPGRALALALVTRACPPARSRSARI